MTLEEIKTATLNGKQVYWSNTGYKVKNKGNQWLIVYEPNQHAIGLTWIDGYTLNGKEKDFFVVE